MSALTFTDKRHRGARSERSLTCDNGCSRSAPHRLEILGYPTGEDFGPAYFCANCAREMAAAWDRALAGFLEEAA